MNRYFREERTITYKHTTRSSTSFVFSEVQIEITQRLLLYLAEWPKLINGSLATKHL